MNSRDSPGEFCLSNHKETEAKGGLEAWPKSQNNLASESSLIPRFPCYHELGVKVSSFQHSKQKSLMIARNMSVLFTKMLGTWQKLKKYLKNERKKSRPEY